MKSLNGPRELTMDPIKLPYGPRELTMDPMKSPYGPRELTTDPMKSAYGPHELTMDPMKSPYGPRGEDPSIKSIILFDVSVQLIVDHHQEMRPKIRKATTWSMEIIIFVIAAMGSITPGANKCLTNFKLKLLLSLNNLFLTLVITYISIGNIPVP